MNNLIRLLETFTQDEQTKRINEHFSKESPSRIFLKGLTGAQDCFVFSGIFSQHNRSQLFIANSKEEAAYIQNSIDNILESKPVLFFPDSFKRPIAFEELNPTNVLQRTEVVNKVHLKPKTGSLLVTYPEALFEKVVAPDYLDKNKIEFEVGENADIDTLVELIVEFGFERVEFVYEPGQFSIRGGIVDIFSYGNEWPYRIELFDEEVETIRTFDPITQISRRNLKRISIIPNINSRFKQEQKVSLFKVISSDCVVWIKSFDMLLDKLQACFEKSEEFGKSLSNIESEDLRAIFEDRAFLYPNEIITDLENHHLICLENPAFKIEFDETYTFESVPQPNFNKNFNLLIEHLNRNTKNGISNFLFSDNPRQIERFHNIFEDLGSQVEFHPIPNSIHEGFIDKRLKVACLTDHQIFARFHKYKLKRGFTKEQALNLRMLRELRPGDFVTHIDHGIGRYSGLEKININGRDQESVRLIYKNNDILYVGINSLHKISKYVGKDGTPPQLNKLGGDSWKNLKRKTKKKVKDIAKELIRLYAKRKASKGFAFEEDGYLQTELEASFIYEDTPDQFTATNDVKADMQKAHPMDRLICGDVGFGKTEVAIRAAFKSIVSGKQVAVLVPTTILALQHYKTFQERLGPFGVTVDFVNRFRSTKERRLIFESLKEGKVDIVIGTHGLLNKEVGFKDLGLLIIDEEQKFGVSAKEKLRNIKVNVDTLTLTATPIPRTLQFSLMAARDLSIIRTPPPNRQPIHTERRVFNDVLIKDAIYFEVNRGGQVFFVHNRVKNLPDIAAMIRRMCPDVEISMAHGQMDSKKLEQTLVDFIEGQFDVLVCTNIIETGLDIPNANTIIINNAHQFGLSDLHQLRGRVGRSNRKAYCYLFAPPLSTLTSEARKRLKTLEEFSELGSGFNIAMRDLDIRGAGNLLGAEQSGFISDIGFETYQKILEEAIQELKEGEFKELFKEDLEKERKYVRDVEITTDIEMLIPDDYVNNIQERLSLYTALDNIEDEEGVKKFLDSLRDRFGKIPKQVVELCNGLRLRWICKSLGFERLSLKGRKMRCYFISNPQSPYFESKIFNNILKYVSSHDQTLDFSLKQSKNFLILIRDDVKNLKTARIMLERLLEEVEPKKT